MLIKYFFFAEKKDIMPEMCYVCGKPTNFVFVKRVREEGNDCSIYECTECKGKIFRGSISEKMLREYFVNVDMPWHFDDERGQFICEYGHKRRVFPVDKPWSCDECWRKCVYVPHLGRATFSFAKKRDIVP